MKGHADDIMCLAYCEPGLVISCSCNGTILAYNLGNIASHHAFNARARTTVVCLWAYNTATYAIWPPVAIASHTPGYQIRAPASSRWRCPTRCRTYRHTTPCDAMHHPATPRARCGPSVRTCTDAHTLRVHGKSISPLEPLEPTAHPTDGRDRSSAASLWRRGSRC